MQVTTNFSKIQVSVLTKSRSHEWLLKNRCNCKLYRDACRLTSPLIEFVDILLRVWNNCSSHTVYDSLWQWWWIHSNLFVKCPEKMLAQVFTDIISKIRRHKQLEALIVHRLGNKSHMKEIIDLLQQYEMSFSSYSLYHKGYNKSYYLWQALAGGSETEDQELCICNNGL